jgi:hypothetical protein
MTNKRRIRCFICDKKKVFDKFKNGVTLRRYHHRLKTYQMINRVICDDCMCESFLKLMPDPKGSAKLVLSVPSGAGTFNSVPSGAGTLS